MLTLQSIHLFDMFKVRPTTIHFYQWSICKGSTLRPTNIFDSAFIIVLYDIRIPHICYSII